MIINITSKSYIAFDLDDTLYKEIDYLKSAYRSISVKIDPDHSDSIYNRMLNLYDKGGNPFKDLEENPYYNVKLDELLDLYRNHKPDIMLLPGIENVLDFLDKYDINYGVITDGRTITQTNKLKCLNIHHRLSDIVISESIESEKPSVKNFKFIEDRNPNHNYIYFGDNLKKDFLTPKQRGWFTCCLINNGLNIHEQNFSKHEDMYLPHLKFNFWTEIKFSFE